MRVVADLHVHSPFARACSKDITLDNLVKYARLKGVSLLGTGDFTHPTWLANLKQQLAEDGSGLLRHSSGFPFLLQTEVANIFSQGGRVRKVHNLILAPSFEVADQVNAFLATKGSLKSDGRPMLGKMTCAEMVEALMAISPEVMVIPAHCLRPDALIHTEKGLKPIATIAIGDMVHTHDGSVQAVTETHKRRYRGIITRIRPWYFSLGLETTPEHPFYAIKTVKDCVGDGGPCKPTVTHLRRCIRHHHRGYKPAWILAESLEVADILVYPRFTQTTDIPFLDFSSYDVPVTNSKTRNFGRISVDEDLCRLFGYYLSEGFASGDSAIGFTFHKNETDYLADVASIMRQKFDLSEKEEPKGNSMTLTFFSKSLNKFFRTNFYLPGHRHTAIAKRIPPELVHLPKEKARMLFLGWWRGDAGATSSRELANQMKMQCLRLGILPSFQRVAEKEQQRARKTKIGTRIIRANADAFVFSQLAFFEDANSWLSQKEFKRFTRKRETRHGWMDSQYAYLPIRAIETEEYDGEVFNLDVEKNHSYLAEFAAVHNCMTPWFGVFGSMSGFDSLHECYQDQTKHIKAIETGLSADPAMLWRISNLDAVNLVSFSDLHSAWPWRLGREATILELPALSYKEVRSGLTDKSSGKLAATIECDPAYGKYHIDGHRACGVSLEPAQSRALDGRCPKCQRSLTIGVLARVEQLADRPIGFKPAGAPASHLLIPLTEVIQARLNASGPLVKKVWEQYSALVSPERTELDVLLTVPEEELAQLADPRVVQGILKLRSGKMEILPGFDGVYGLPVFEEADRSKPRRFDPEPRKTANAAGEAQKRGRPPKTAAPLTGQKTLGAFS